MISSDLGGFRPIVDSTGRITGYKTTVGADTVFPFSGILVYGEMVIEYVDGYGTFLSSDVGINDDSCFSTQRNGYGLLRITAVASGKYTLHYLHTARGGVYSLIMLKNDSAVHTFDPRHATYEQAAIELAAGDVITFSYTRLNNEPNASNAIGILITYA